MKAFCLQVSSPVTDQPQSGDMLKTLNTLTSYLMGTKRGDLLLIDNLTLLKSKSNSESSQTPGNSFYSFILAKLFDPVYLAGVLGGGVAGWRGVPSLIESSCSLMASCPLSLWSGPSKGLVRNSWWVVYGIRDLSVLQFVRVLIKWIHNRWCLVLDGDE